MQASPKVLLVEDDPDLRATLSDWLAGSGYTVREARDGREAILAARDQAFDVAVTDLKMPGMDGLELLAAFQEVRSPTRFIFLSGQATVEHVIEALREGRAFDFLQKPLYDLRELNRAIGRALARDAPPEAVPAPPASPPLHVSRGPAVAPENGLVHQVRCIIEDRFREPISLRDVAAEVGYSASYLTDFVARATGRSVQRWITEHRLREAQRLLRERDWSIARVGAAVGYADTNHFVRQFRRCFGSPPGQWRKQSAAPDAGPRPTTRDTAGAPPGEPHRPADAGPDTSKYPPARHHRTVPGV